MVVRVLLFLIHLLLHQTCVQAQKFLGKQKEAVLALMQKGQQRYGLKGEYKQDQKRLFFFIRDSAYLPLDVVFEFDSAGACVTETVSGCCTCADKWIEPENKLKWHPVAPGRWVSDYNKKAALNKKEKDGQVTYTISQVWWTRDEYKNYLKASAKE